MAAATVALVSLLASSSALAQEPNQVPDVTAVHGDGFTTVRWAPVAGATDYQVERTPVDAADAPTGPATIVGVWQPNRTVTPDRPAFADSGFALGDRFRWRVRARVGAAEQPFSEPLFGTTQPQWGTGPGADLRTQYETAGDGAYTNDVNEYAYEAALDAASPRVRLVEIGRTIQNRPINMFIIGAPAPPATAREISGAPTYAVTCNVHGNEPSGRESCLIMARELAFTQDPRLLAILSRITVLLVPSINGDGRAANTRGNATGQDLNRDYSLIREPETKAFVAMLRDYTPEVVIDSHEGDSEDLPILSSRHLNVEQTLFDEAKSGMVEGWMYDHAAADGWWMGPYNNGGDSNEGILRNTLGLKNMVGMLAEARPSGGATRPAEGTLAANRNRKVYSHLWEFFQGLEYHWSRLTQIQNAINHGIAFNSANTGRVVLRGSYPWPAFPGVGGPPLPVEDAPTPDRILADPPCGYFLTDDQYVGANLDGTVEERLRAHGIAVERWPTGYLVRLAQPQRGLIPTLLDAQAVVPMVAAQRLSDCPAKGQVDVGGTVPATLSLTVGGPASFGAFEPGVARDHTASTTANVTSTAGDAVLSIADPAAAATGRLVNGAFALPRPLQSRARNAANTGTAFNDVGAGLNLLAYDGPTTNDAVSLQFRQPIGATDALRSGRYAKTLVLTLSTTTP